MTIKSLATRFGKGAVSKQTYVYELWARWVARGIQFILALVVVGLYGTRVDRDRRHGDPQSPAWVYALFVAGVSCITCVLYAIPNPFSKRLAPHRLFAWDVTLFILWIAVFGAFAAIFLKREEDEYQGTSVAVMKCAVWVDLVNALLWMGTAAYGGVRTFLGRKVNGKIDHYTGKVEDAVNAKVDKGLNNFSMKLNPQNKETV
ncbi:hypothetical protein F4821DRAFT_31390 [Hypoxylon rubiginosum]|uniref:Uncharacterized protein n=1 Tax=Hypoxylon rubiginosum TaxID=110542 RepID=A0ACC0CLW0_9PEZI|nr:hypothetical protein F4821DRAFT_31390 [Hypoxylon rubiginosum]